MIHALPLATNWATISSLATAGGTLALAIATFASIRSANRSARIAEVALQEQRRPMLAPSRLEDPVQKIMFVDDKWFRVQGSRGVAEYTAGNIYLVLSLRNVGAGIAVCHGWAVRAGLQTTRRAPRPIPLGEFRPQTRDLYISGGDVGLWQGAIRSAEDPDHAALAEAIQKEEPISIEILYSDAAGGQRTITRFGLTAWPDETRFAHVTRHWFLDAAGPRDEAARLSRAEQILGEFAAREQAAPDGYSSDEKSSVPGASASSSTAEGASGSG